MRKSMVHFFFLLSILSLGLTLLPCAFSSAEDIEILSYSWYIDTSGYLVVVGEVQNVGSNTIESVYLTGIVYNTDGMTQAYSSSLACVTYLIPQQRAPFYMQFPMPFSSIDGSWGSADISFVDFQVYSAEATTSYQYPDLTIKDSSTTVTEGVYWVSGTVQNTGSQTTEEIVVVGTFYNASGVVVTIGYSEYLTSLSPSGEASFKVGSIDLNQSEVSSDKIISSYSLLIQTEAPILVGTAPSISPTPTPSSATQSPDSTASGSNETDYLPPESIYIILFVICGLGAAVAVWALRKHKSRV